MADHITDEAVTAPNRALVEAVRQALKPESIRAALVEFWGDAQGANVELNEVLEGGILDSVMKRVEPLFAALPVLNTTTDAEIAELRAKNEALKAKLNEAYQHIGEQALVDMEEPVPPYGSPEREARVKALRGEQG